MGHYTRANKTATANLAALAYTRQAGFTLVEFMVALGISLFLVGGAMAIMLNGSRSSTFNENMSKMQESLRMAVFNMEQDIRMAGYWGCGLDIELNNQLGQNHPLVSNLHGIEGWTGTQWKPSNEGALTSTSVSILANTDAITVRHIGGEREVQLQNPMAARNSTLSLNINRYAANENLAITNCDRTDLFTYGANRPLSLAYTSGTVSRLRFVRYFVADNSGVPTLYRQIYMNNQVLTQPMFANIEKLKIRYGQDNQAPFDGSPDSFVDAASVTDWNRVTVVRIGILARSEIMNDLPQDENEYKLFDTQVLDKPGDRRIRRIIYSNIQIRNAVI